MNKLFEQKSWKDCVVVIYWTFFSFQSLFLVNPNQHPIVILKDVQFEDLKTIVQFMYQGSVEVSSDKISGFIKVTRRFPDYARLWGVLSYWPSTHFVDCGYLEDPRYWREVHWRGQQNYWRLLSAFAVGTFAAFGQLKTVFHRIITRVSGQVRSIQK